MAPAPTPGFFVSVDIPNDVNYFRVLLLHQWHIVPSEIIYRPNVFTTGEQKFKKSLLQFVCNTFFSFQAEHIKNLAIVQDKLFSLKNAVARTGRLK